MDSNTKYLAEDIVGALSRYVYGVTGAKVTVVEVRGNQSLVRDEDGSQFHVLNHLLTDTKPNYEQTTSSNPEIDRGHPPGKKGSKAKAAASPAPQASLFG